MKKAFTLIELLVVIAIIAILAAILFPVFAQAKASAKKTGALSNAKQSGTAMQLYLGDNDDLYPRSSLYIQYGGGYLSGIVFPFPADDGASKDYDTDEVRRSSAETYPNSVQPYTKGTGTMAQGPNEIVIPDFTFRGPSKPALFGLTMNGLFQNLSSSVVQNPSAAVTLWSGVGDGNYKGFAVNNPAYEGCGSEGPCVWDPAGGIGTLYRPNPAWSKEATPWAYAKGVAVVRADGSAKWRKIANQVNKNNKGPFNTDVWNDPFSAVYYSASTGWNGQIFLCNTNAGTGSDPASTDARYPCFFRPDRLQ